MTIEEIKEKYGHVALRFKNSFVGRLTYGIEEPVPITIEVSAIYYCFEECESLDNLTDVCTVHYIIIDGEKVFN
jgi:hypothetical protein